MTHCTQTAAALILARYSGAGRTVYGGAEPDGEALARSYRYWRQRHKPAAEALRLAVADSESKRSRWPDYGGAAKLGAPMDDGGQWIEDAAGAGLRFVGFADDLARRYGSRMEYSGWFTDPDGFGELLRGCVYQLPADPDGRPRYVPAYREGDDSRDGWRDTSTGRDGGAAVVYLREIELGEPGGAESEVEQAALDAARFADSRAERHAESQREFREADSAGQRAGQLLGEAAEARREFLALRAELKAESPRSAGSAICAALAGQLRELAATWRKAKAKAAELERDWTQGWRGDLAEAFREGKDSANVC